MENLPTSVKKRTALNCNNAPQKLYTVRRIADWIEDPWSDNGLSVEEDQWQQELDATPPTPRVSSCSENSIREEDIKNLVNECEQTITELRSLLKFRERYDHMVNRLRIPKLLKMLQMHRKKASEHNFKFKDEYIRTFKDVQGRSRMSI